MKNLPKIIKGNRDLLSWFIYENLDMIFGAKDEQKFRVMIESVFNAGKNGIVDPDLSAKFEEFYKLYPRKKSPKLALKAYSTARKDVEHDVIMKGLREQLPELNYQFNVDETKVKHPSSWLNAGDWMNEVKGKPSVNSDAMTDEQIFSTSWGQGALKQGSGYTLRIFIAKHGRKPAKPEYQAILDEPKGPFILAENKKLMHYLKD